MAEKKVAAKKTTKKATKTVETVEAPDVILNEVKDLGLDSSADPQNDNKKPEKKEAKTSKSKTGSSKHEAKSKLSAEERKYSRKYREAALLVDKMKEYSVEEAVELIKKTSTTKFDSSVEVHIRLNIDPQNADQQVRGSLVLPHGTGKTKKVLAIVGPDKEKEAKDAGADFVGGEDMIAKIEKGWLDFEVVVATPDMMPKLGKIGKILGTKGLMPNPKVGTVTANVGKVVADIKKGMIEYKVDKVGIMHLVIGRVSFDAKQLVENYNTLLETVVRVRPSGVKGTYIKGVSIATTMGPGIKVTVK